MITIIQGGQTGVDRGAWRGAFDAGLPRRGYGPYPMLDEWGTIPSEVRRDMQPGPPGTGLRARTRMNVESCSTLIVCIGEPMSTARYSPGTAYTLMCAQELDRRRYIHWREGWLTSVPDKAEITVADFAARLSPDTQLMIAGPRESKWDLGFFVAQHLVEQIGRHVHR